MYMNLQGTYAAKNSNNNMNVMKCPILFTQPSMADTSLLSLQPAQIDRTVQQKLIMAQKV